MSKLICSKCAVAFSVDKPRWRCDCGGILDIEFKPAFNLDKIAARKHSMWRYREAIPIERDSNVITIDEGFTPLLKVDFNGSSVFVKQEHLFQTGSYKDRGASVLISKTKELGIAEVIEDSSGNAGSAIAAYCGRAGIKCRIHVPADTSPGKLTQIKAYGAVVHEIPGNRAEAAKSALAEADNTYYASHSWNPYFLHGTKTFAYEICEQLGWQSPDSVVLPVGNGTLLLGAYIGFNELSTSEIINKIPRLIAVQAANCAPLQKMFDERLNELPSITPAGTIAEGIAIAVPIRGTQIINAVRQTGGRFLTVTEAEIEKSLNDMCRRGFYIEPTAAATIAGLEKYLPEANGDELIVSAFTGHGLKAGDKMMKIPD